MNTGHPKVCLGLGPPLSYTRTQEWVGDTKGPPIESATQVPGLLALRTASWPRLLNCSGDPSEQSWETEVPAASTHSQQRKQEVQLQRVRWKSRHLLSCMGLCNRQNSGHASLALPDVGSTQKKKTTR